jgi:hypothetical protein
LKKLSCTVDNGADAVEVLVVLFLCTEVVLTLPVIEAVRDEAEACICEIVLVIF